MEYYEELGLRKEPFSTSPDPDFFFYSQEHKECIQRLEINIRLKRGLSVILGDVGTGKTTLSRMIIKLFDTFSSQYDFHLILDPAFESEFEFVKNLASVFDIKDTARSTFEYKMLVENFLYKRAVEENKVVVLVVDEGQKLTSLHIEALRTLLNYETNDFKLLQLIILAQSEFMVKIKRQPNFLDRISLGYVINPINEEDTKGLIEYRLKKAGYRGKYPLFSDEAVSKIYQYTQGYPRKITQFCHNVLIELLRNGKEQVEEDMVVSVIRKESPWHV
ncbi:MAG: AAA family ATPase [Candidatus Marinimicrobia bacterium]|nr:AAA family ATPase [Candidatus Neomarinimicrobiota bacterium]